MLQPLLTELTQVSGTGYFLIAALRVSFRLFWRLKYGLTDYFRSFKSIKSNRQGGKNIKKIGITNIFSLILPFFIIGLLVIPISTATASEPTDTDVVVMKCGYYQMN